VRRGAIDCIGKPVAAIRFAEVIQRHCGVSYAQTLASQAEREI